MLFPLLITDEILLLQHLENVELSISSDQLHCRLLFFLLLCIDYIQFGFVCELEVCNIAYGLFHHSNKSRYEFLNSCLGHVCSTLFVQVKSIEE